MVLPKHMRLKGHRCFDLIYKEGVRFQSPSMILRVTKGNKKLQSKATTSSISSGIKCAVSVSNKVSKKSVTRNKLRRLLHHHLSYKLSKVQYVEELWAFITLKPDCMKNSNTNLLNQCDKLLLKAGITK